MARGPFLHRGHRQARGLLNARTHPVMVTNTRFAAYAEKAAARYGIALVDSMALRPRRSPRIPLPGMSNGACSRSHIAGR